jgi:integrase
MPDGSRVQKKVTIGSKLDYPTETAAHDKLDDIRRELHKDESQPIQKPTTNGKPVNFAELVQRWGAAEGAACGDNSLKHYTYALRTYTVPHFGDFALDEITREGIQIFLNDKAKSYSKSSLKSMKVTLSMTLEWARQNHWITHNPVEKLRLPKKTGGYRIARVVLKWEQIVALMNEMQEPYRTLVLFLALVPKRIEEAIALRPSDLDEHNVLHIRRVIYERQLVDFEESEHESIPLDSPMHAELVSRLRQLGEGHNWIFHTRAGTPLDPHNGLTRHLHPGGKAIGIRLGGWHDFRHTFNTMMRRAGVHTKVLNAALGHGKSTGVLAHDVYDHVSADELRRALVMGANWLMREEVLEKALLGDQLCPQLCPETQLHSGQSVSY